MSENLKVAFFGSSNFVEVILQNILESKNRSISNQALQQLDWLLVNHAKFISLFPETTDKKLFEELRSQIAQEPNLQKPVDLCLIVTQPARENRGKTVSNPIIDFATQNKLQLFTPEKIRLELEQFKTLTTNLDMGIVASYGQILPESLLGQAKYGFINWHPSALPKYRGPTPMQTALYNADKETGLSWIEMSKSMDAGPILLQLNSNLGQTQDFFRLAKIMGGFGANTWALALSLQVLSTKKSFSYEPRKQNEDDVIFCKMLSKEDKFVDLQNISAEQIWNHWRAYQAFPGTWIKNQGKEIKLIQLGEIKLLQEIKEKALKIEGQDDILRIETKAGWENWLPTKDSKVIKLIKISS